MLKNEHRRALRKPVSMNAYLATGQASLFSIPFRTHMVNLSRTGAMLHTPEPVIDGDTCTLTLVDTENVHGQLEGRIVWCKEDKPGTYYTGVAFRNLSPDNEYIIDLQMLRHTA